MNAVVFASVLYETALIKGLHMKFQKPHIRFAFALGLFGASIAAAESSEDSVEMTLPVPELPVDLWSKQRLAPEPVEDGLRLRDTGSGAFNDASFWQIHFDAELPYGRKMLSFDVSVASNHAPLWGEQLLQPMIDGKEAAPALDDTGMPSFEKVIANDGKGFITVPQGGAAKTITLDIPKTTTRLSSFAFMTAGATGFDMTLSDFKIVAWPEQDNRVFAPNPLATSLGFLPGHPQTVLIEWPGFDPSVETEPNNAIVRLSGRGGDSDISVPLPRRLSTASGSAVSRITLNLDPGSYTLTAPGIGPKSIEGKTSFQVASDSSALARMRDEAWGAFYWITAGPNGPFPDAHPQDAAAKVFESEGTRDVSGGWYDAGDYGKYTVNGSWAVALMLLTGLNAPDALEHSISPLAGASDKPDWIDVAVAQLDWLAKMQGPDGGVNHKATTREWPLLDIAPHDDFAVKYFMPVSSTATADFAATMALGARVLARYDPARAERFKVAAERALLWLDANPGLIMIERLYDESAYGGPYIDSDDSDERFFALASWAALTQSSEAIAAAESQLNTRLEVLNASKNSTYWGQVDLLGMWALYSIRDVLSEDGARTVQGSLQSAAHKWRVLQQRSAWLLPMADDEGYPWGSNGTLATVGWHWLMWSNASGDDNFARAAKAMLPYFHGRNPLGQTYVTNAVGVRNPHLRPVVSGAIELPPGFIAGGANSMDLAGDPTSGAILGQPPLRMFVDDKESYATNEVAINWQSAWALYASLLMSMR